MEAPAGTIGVRNNPLRTIRICQLPNMEINAVKSEIKALRARFDALRGYL